MADKKDFPVQIPPGDPLITRTVSQNLEYQKNLKLVLSKMAPFNNKNVIVLSGDESSRETIGALLRRLTFPSSNIVLTSVANRVVNQLVETDSVHIVICDIKISESKQPPISALKFYLKIKKTMEVKGKVFNTPFVVMSTQIDRETIIQGYRVGVSNFLVLPTDEITLGNKILDLFQKQMGETDRVINKLIQEGDEFQRQGATQMAISRYDEALKVGGDSSEVLTKKADALFKEGSYDEAMVLYRRAVEVEKNSPRAYQGLGNCHHSLGDVHRAGFYFKKVLTFEPDNVNVIYQMGEINLKEGEYKEAGSYFKKGISLAPQSVNNYLGMAKVHEENHKIGEALQYYRQALVAQPQQTHLYVSAGNFCIKHNQMDVAEEIFTEGLRLNEKSLHLYNRLGIALRKQEKYSQAITNYQKALEIDPKDGNLHFNLAKAYACSRDLKRAKEALDEAVKLDPDLKSLIEEDIDLEAFWRGGK